jgi:hypothetical protein
MAGTTADTVIPDMTPEEVKYAERVERFYVRGLQEASRPCGWNVGVKRTRADAITEAVRRMVIIRDKVRIPPTPYYDEDRLRETYAGYGLDD